MIIGGIHYDVCRNGRWMGSKNCFKMQLDNMSGKERGEGESGQTFFKVI